MGGVAKRVVLFLAVNFLIIIAISVILSICNIQPYLSKRGLDLRALMTFCLIWGMCGAFISLGLSRIMAKWMLGIKPIDPNTSDLTERQLLNMVWNLARKSGLRDMPEVGIYDSPEVNAFATGPTKSRALVAVSSGLLRRMNWPEIEGVLGHEVSHVANGDMVTMALLTGVVNAFVMFFARLIAYVIMQMGRSRDSDTDILPSSFLYNILVFAFEIVFMILASIVIAWFSRYREYRADAGGAQLAGKEKMIAALQALQETVQVRDPAVDAPSVEALKIDGESKLLRLFSSHPPLAERIARLQSRS